MNAQVVEILFLIVSILLIVIIILQKSNEDASQAFTGKKSELFANKKERGIDVWINVITSVLSVAFFILAILAAFFAKR